MQHLLIAKVLQSVELRITDLPADIFDGLPGDNRFDTGRAKFVIDTGVHDNLDTGKNGIRIAVALDIGPV